MVDTFWSNKARPSWREWSLAAVLASRFALVAVVSVIAFALIIGLTIVPSVHRDIEERHHALSSAVVAQVDSYFAVADRELKALAVMLGNDAVRNADANALLDTFVGASTFYEAIYLTDNAGRVSAIGLPNAVKATRSNHLGLDVSHRQFVQRAQATRMSYWSDSFLSPISLRLAIAVAIPVGDRTLIGEIALTPLPEFANRLTAGLPLVIMMVDRQNQLTAHSTGAYANQQLNIATLPPIEAARSRKNHGQMTFSFDGSELVGSAWPIAGLDWLVVIAQPANRAYAPIRAIWQRFWSGILFAFLAALAAGWWTARALSRRFQAYNRQAEQIASGHYDLKIAATSVREFNEMRTSLQRMATAIQDREDGMSRAQHSMAELNASLEDRVKKRTDELLRAEKLAALGSMVAGIAHELNTPIGNAVLVASTLAGSDRELAGAIEKGNLRRSTLERFLADHRAAVDMMLKNLDRASELIQSFKQVAIDQTSANRRAFELSHFVGEIAITMHPVLKRTPHRLSIDIPDGLVLDSYPGPLGQVLTNLIGNALTHAYDGRSPEDGGEIIVHAVPLEGERVELSVIDNGNGIPPEHIGKVFDPFFTTKFGKGGSGLGLNIAYSIVTSVLGGRIDVTSEVGRGTRFTLTIPLHAPRHDDVSTAS